MYWDEFHTQKITIIQTPVKIVSFISIIVHYLFRQVPLKAGKVSFLQPFVTILHCQK